MANIATVAKVVPVTVAPAQVAPTQYIAMLVAGNPKMPKGKSHARFALYVHGQTVAAYKAASLAAGSPAKFPAADLLWDQKHGFISLHATAALADAARAAALKPAAPAKA